ncbi:hypothetical protein [Actinophytocola sp.]|jgi:hypothetical protein|uniref:hypothetical protein n=1 Tax=Actinophytocola sp. TaxID=1872138 RepID=UPI002ED7A9D2
MRKAGIRLVGVAGAVVLLLGVLTVAAGAAPGGMSRFTVAIGGLSVSSRTNWVRLGTYSFTAGGQVTESHFHWSQRERVVRTSTGVRAANCVARDCVVRTANGYEASSQPDHLSGTYTVTGTTLRITWTGNGWEQWQVSQPISGKLAKLTYQGSSFGATHGFGYGSNAAWTARASMAQVAAFDHTKLKHDYHLWKTNAGTPYLDEGSGNPFWVLGWDPCASSRCLGARTTGTEYYLSTANTTSTDRRDTMWHWRTSLADGRGETCYTGNSHVKPMLQIIDSDGGFHGWVAVEASLNQTVPDQGTSADDIGVFEISEFG